MKRVVQGYQRGYLRVRNGQYELLYRDLIAGPDGRIRRPRRTVQLGPETISVREAERLRDDVLAKVNKQKRPRREETFADFVNGTFFETKLPTLSKNCQDNYRHLLKRHAFPFFGHRQLTEISREDVRRFLVGRSTKFSWHTVRDIRTAVSSVLTLAVEDGLIGTNPVWKVKIAREPVSEPYFIPSKEALAKFKTALS